MKPFISSLAFLILSAACLSAQTATPAQPVDPNQAIPAQPAGAVPVPVMPDAIPATPATPAPAVPSTSAPSTTDAPVAVTIIADSSLKAVLQELAQSWADTFDSGPQVPLTLTNAGTLRGKVEGGTVWDVVISADVQDVQGLTTQGFLFADGQRSLARNTVVVYGRKALVKDDEPEWFDLIGTEWKKVAMGNPDLVASGRVAQRALEKHGLGDADHKPLFITAPAETLALAAVEREEADAVFVYKTDLAKITLPGFDVFQLATEDAPPVFYTAAVSRLAKNPAQARAFIDYCGSDVAKPIWTKYGFETN